MSGALSCALAEGFSMSVSRRAFLEKVGRAGGYSALYVTMQALGLLGAAPA